MSIKAQELKSIREWVKRGYQSVAARYVKTVLDAFDNEVIERERHTEKFKEIFGHNDAYLYSQYVNSLIHMVQHPDQYAQEQQSEGLPKPTDNALIKIGSALVHFDELTSIDGHPYDKVAAKTALEDEEVQNWLNKMADLALLPQRRKPPSK